MRVIHGVWAHGALCLWAEDPDLPPLAGAISSGAISSGTAPSGVHLPRPHPFACQAAELADLLAGSPPGSASTSAGDAARKAVHDELTLQLPSAGGGPLASPELVRPEAPGVPGTSGDLGSGPARPGVAGELAGARARPRPRRRARAPVWLWMGRFRPARRSRDRRRVADLPGRGGAFRGRPGRPRPGAARARGRAVRGLRRGGGRCSAVPTRSAPVTWPRPCPRPAGPPPGRPRGRCSAAPWMPWPTPPRGPG